MNESTQSKITESKSNVRSPRKSRPKTKLAKPTSPSHGSVAKMQNLLAGTHNVGAITKITMDELNHRLEDWLCECATTEEEWDVIAEYSFHRKIKLVNKMYDGGIANFLVDAFPETV